MCDEKRVRPLSAIWICKPDQVGTLVWKIEELAVEHKTKIGAMKGQWRKMKESKKTESAVENNMWNGKEEI